VHCRPVSTVRRKHWEATAALPCHTSSASFIAAGAEAGSMAPTERGTMPPTAGMLFEGFCSPSP